jgi:putative protease
MAELKFSLPLIATPSVERWQGLAVAGTLPEIAWASSEDAPEPTAPQGEYSGDAAPLAVPQVPGETKATPVELLSPAGGLDAAFAAFHFGADAVYLGLKKFSARAEAENFTLEELDEIVAYAHQLSPKRRVFVTINTLIRQDELAELLDALASLVEIGVDAVIVQDLGVYHAIRRWFPQLELHGSTQMAVHNQAGAVTLRNLGFQRVVLARELTFEEVHDITSTAGVETEVFIHGALCYSYSGLCLFSSQLLGRSGNRGKCAYSCRDSYEVAGAPLTLRDGSPVKRDPRAGFPFSMKDLALPDHLPALRAAGVSCFKIEGRKKSPLYVATTTDYYRRLIDGNLAPEERPEIEAELQAVFSRPWTRLFVQSHKDKEVADRDTVGHRGAYVGKVAAVRDERVRFRTQRALQKHDGLQVDLPVLGKPYGFAIDKMYVAAKKGDKPAEVFEAPADTLVEVALPADHPELPVGAPVYQSSSQAVKQKYRVQRPKPGLWHGRKPLHVEATLNTDGLHVRVWTPAILGSREPLVAEKTLAGPVQPTHDLAVMEEAARSCFARLGESAFALAEWTWSNPVGGFVQKSRINQLRRDLVDELTKTIEQKKQRWIATIDAEALPKISAKPVVDFRWSIKIDRMSFLDAFEAEDWNNVDEVVIDVTRDHPATLREKLDQLAETIGRDRIRLALPALTRKWEEKGLLSKIDTLRAAGWKKWEAANLSAWHYLGIDPNEVNSDLDLATDWSIYVINRLAAKQVIEMGATRFALSPEDGLANWRPLLKEFGEQAVLIVHQDTPQFLAESCAYANLIGGCPGKANCSFESMEMESSHGEKVLALDYHCRTIVLDQGPFCLSTRLKDLAKAGASRLRADFIYRPYAAESVRDRWRLVRAGKPVPAGHEANCDRGIL